MKESVVLETVREVDGLGGGVVGETGRVGVRLLSEEVTADLGDSGHDVVELEYLQFGVAFATGLKLVELANDFTV